MVGDDAMTNAAKGREIARLFVAEPGVGAMVDFDRAIFALAIAKPAAEARGLELSQSRGAIPPASAVDIRLIDHDSLVPYRRHKVVYIK